MSETIRESGNDGRYSRAIRVLHALVAIAVAFQLAVSLVMDAPHGNRPMSGTGELLFRSHEAVGLAALAILAVGWLYRLVSWRRESQSKLFPWATRAGARALMAELNDFISLRWTRIPREGGALSGTLHGLGLLLVSAMVVTGGVLYIELGPHDTVSRSVKTMMDVHSFLATLVWIYFCGHVVMALWHQYVGHGTLVRMFRL